jgi:RHS repeat-associated protein
LSQVTHKDDGTTEDGFYGYNPHTDVDQVTNDSGDTKATYGYTAYGKNDDAQFTGIDKPDAADPTKEPYNAYRFNAKRWDQNSQSYDMGFRDYSPGLNRFITRDSYNGALADMHLGLNPFTGNRYGFDGGNPISMIEYDGHIPLGPDDPGGGGATTSSGCGSANACEHEMELKPQHVQLERCARRSETCRRLLRAGIWETTQVTPVRSRPTTAPRPRTG